VNANAARAEGPPPGLRERGKRRRTERILDAGLDLLREDPQGNLTVERIADRAEVSPMTVFNLWATASSCGCDGRPGT